MARSIIFIESKVEPPCLESLKQAISQSQELELNETAHSAKLAQLIQSGWAGLVVLVLSNKDDVINAIQFLTKHSKVLQKAKTLRVIALNSLPNSKIQSVFMSLGCAETVDFKVTSKTLLHKIRRHLKLVSIAEAMNLKRVKSEAAESGSAQNVAQPTHRTDYWVVRSPPRPLTDGEEMESILAEDFPDYDDEEQRVSAFQPGFETDPGHMMPSEEAEFSTLADAFKPTGVNVALNSISATILSAVENLIVLRVENGDFAISNLARLEILTNNLQQDVAFDQHCNVLNVEMETDSPARIIQLELNEQARDEYAKVENAIAERQLSLLRFLRMARGT